MFLLQHCDFVYGTSNDKLIITLKIPLTLFENEFSVYRVLSYPLKLPNSQEHLVEIETLPAGIAVETSQDRYFTLNAEQLQKLQNAHSYSMIQRIFNTRSNQSCVMSVFADKTQEINQVCNYHIIMHSLETRIYQLSDKLFYLINMPESILQCDKNSTVFLGCQACVLEFNSQCSFQSETHYITETISPAQNIVKVGYVANKALLMNFFNEDTLKFLKDFL